VDTGSLSPLGPACAVAPSLKVASSTSILLARSTAVAAAGAQGAKQIGRSCGRNAAGAPVGNKTLLCMVSAGCTSGVPRASGSSACKIAGLGRSDCSKRPPCVLRAHLSTSCVAAARDRSTTSLKQAWASAQPITASVSQAYASWPTCCRESRPRAWRNNQTCHRRVRQPVNALVGVGIGRAARLMQGCIATLGGALPHTVASCGCREHATAVPGST
jgi:hypothetical protein